MEFSNYAKHNGYVNSLNRNNRNQNSSIPFDPDDDVFPTKDTNTSKSKSIQPETNSALIESKICFLDFYWIVLCYLCVRKEAKGNFFVIQVLMINHQILF